MQKTFHGIDVYSSDLVELPSPSEVRRLLFTMLADPLYFKAQRGEATEQEWLDMIAEIKSCYPDP